MRMDSKVRTQGKRAMAQGSPLVTPQVDSGLAALLEGTGWKTRD